MRFLQPPGRRGGSPKAAATVRTPYSYRTVALGFVVVLLPVLVAGAVLSDGLGRVTAVVGVAAGTALLYGVALRSRAGTARARAGGVELPLDTGRAATIAFGNVALGTFLLLTYLGSGTGGLAAWLGSFAGGLVAAGGIASALVHRSGRARVVLDPDGITFGFPWRRTIAWRDIKSARAGRPPGGVSMTLRSGGSAELRSGNVAWSDETVAEVIEWFAGRSQHRPRLTDPSALDRWTGDPGSEGSS